jgi:transposase
LQHLYVRLDAFRADRVKLAYWDGTGVCLLAKRLEDGKFRWPNVQDGVIRLSAAQLSALLEGLDWRRVHAARETSAPMQPGDCGRVNQPCAYAPERMPRMI